MYPVAGLVLNLRDPNTPVELTSFKAHKITIPVTDGVVLETDGQVITHEKYGLRISPWRRKPTRFRTTLCYCDVSEADVQELMRNSTETSMNSCHFVLDFAIPWSELTIN